jgi:L-lysine exporter family protein LysE/ArgO
MSTTAFFQGFALSLALIAAIGPQNLHVLRTGITQRHVGATVAFCVGADAVLLAAGLAGGAGALAAGAAQGVLRAVACVALAWMALRAARDACRASAGLAAEAGAPLSLGRALGATAAVTLANPAVWIETVLLVGATGAPLPAAERGCFGAGAIAASLLWFSALAYGGRRAAPWLARPTTWRVLAATSAFSLAASAWALASPSFVIDA